MTTPARGIARRRSQVSSNCIFVNRKGMKVAEMTVNEISLCCFAANNARLFG